MGVLLAVVLSVGAFLVFAFFLRWLILGRLPQGIALLGREVESLRERVARLEEDAARREETPSS